MNNRQGQVESGVFQNLVIAVVVVSAISIMGVAWIAGLNTNYGGNIETTGFTAINRFNEINATIGEFSEKIQGTGDQQPESTNIIDLIVTAGYSLIKVMFQVPNMMFGMIYDTQASLGLPSEVAWVGASVVLVLVIFAAFAVIMKVRA